MCESAIGGCERISPPLPTSAAVAAAAATVPREEVDDRDDYVHLCKLQKKMYIVPLLHT